MSMDSVVLVVILIALALVERLVRALRVRTPTPAEAAAARPTHQEPAGTPSPVSTPPLVPGPRYPTPGRLGAGERIRAQRTVQRAVVATPMRRDSLPPPVRGAGLPSTRLELRRAMMLLAILGPCKGLAGDANPRSEVTPG
jgi:hypothetical protein